MKSHKLSFKEIQKIAPKSLAILPVGSHEQHGPYLPLGTDAIIAAAVACEVEKKMKNSVVLFPTLWYGCAREHTGFAGSIIISFETYLSLIREISQSIFASG